MRDREAELCDALARIEILDEEKSSLTKELAKVKRKLGLLEWINEITRPKGG